MGDRCQSDSLGNAENISNNPINVLSDIYTHEGSDFWLSQESTEMIDYVIIYANITSDAYMLAIANNSKLNAKTHVFVIAQDNITINGLRLTTGQSTYYTAPFPSSLYISTTDLVFVVALKKVGSLDDIEDSDRPTNASAIYNEMDLMRIALVGIPSFLGALATMIVVMVIFKESKVVEGLPNEL